MNRVLALDLGTKTGFALGTFDGPRSLSVLRHGTHRFPRRSGEGPGRPFNRFRFSLETLGVFPVRAGAKPFERVDLVVYEEVMQHRTSRGFNVLAAHFYGALQAILLAECDAARIAVESVSVKRLKKFATGAGNASKEKVREAVERRFFVGPCPSLTFDESDAIALLWYASANFIIR